VVNIFGKNKRKIEIKDAERLYKQLETGDLEITKTMIIFVHLTEGVELEDEYWTYLNKLIDTFKESKQLVILPDRTKIHPNLIGIPEGTEVIKTKTPNAFVSPGLANFLHTNSEYSQFILVGDEIPLTLLATNLRSYLLEWNVPSNVIVPIEGIVPSIKKKQLDSSVYDLLSETDVDMVHYHLNEAP